MLKDNPHKNSREYLARARKCIPCVTQTLSKGPDQFVEGVFPTYLLKGRGSKVYDLDGTEYIDYISALGPVLLGYGMKEINDAIMEQLKDGIIFSLPHPLEVDLAEEIINVIPCAEMVRYAKNGSDVTNAAVRLARAITGREMIAHCGYHGSHDWHAVRLPFKGIPSSAKELLVSFEYNNPDSLERLFKENPNKIAAVIMEPIIDKKPTSNFLEKVKEITHKNKALLIFDEIKTGFRFALGGAQEYFGVTPDLACFGKAMANGMPLSILVGKKEYMEKCSDIFFSMTAGGETLSLAAARATIKFIQDKDVIKHIWGIGEKLQKGYQSLVDELGVNSESNGMPPAIYLSFKDNNGKESLVLKSIFLQETIKRGVLTNCAIYVSYSHTEEDIKKTLQIFSEALKVVKKAQESNNPSEFLEGKPIVNLFSREG